MGFVLLQGYDRYRTYLKGRARQARRGHHVFRVGAFKSAVETYTRTSHAPRIARKPQLPQRAVEQLPAAVTRARKLRRMPLTSTVGTLAKTVPARAAMPRSRAAGGARHRRQVALEAERRLSSSSVRTT